MENFKLQHMVVDLSKPIACKDIGTVFGSGDSNANRFTVAVEKDGQSVSLTGCTVTGYLIMPNTETLRISGSVEDNQACVVIPKSGYVYDGAFQLAVKVVVSGAENTVAIFNGVNIATTTKNISDGEKVIYGVNDILNMMEAMDEATNNANTATDNANTATDNANTAANRANTAANAVEGMTVSAVAGSAPNAEISEINGVKHIDFTLKTGATPDITFEVATGAAGTQVQVEQSGTPENPTVKLTIPRGDTGAIDGIDYFEGEPSALGTATPGTVNGVARGDHVHPMPTAADVGALPEGGTAVNTDAFGGKTLEQVKAEIRLEEHAIGSFYISSNSTSPAELFGGTWEQIKDRVLMAAGDIITAGSTGGAFTHEHGLSTAYAKIRYIDAGRLASADVSGEWTGNRRTAAVLDPAAYEYTYSVGTALGGNTDAADHTSPYLGVYVWHRIA